MTWRRRVRSYQVSRKKLTIAAPWKVKKTKSCQITVVLSREEKIPDFLLNLGGKL